MICIGRVVRPVKESETFLSTLGHLDRRMDLDKSIRPDHTRYYSALSVMAAKISYENRAYVENTVKNHWKVYAPILPFIFFGSKHKM